MQTQIEGASKTVGQEFLSYDSYLVISSYLTDNRYTLITLHFIFVSIMYLGRYAHITLQENHG